MGTRKIKDARDLNTGERIYFVSHAKATFMSDGSTVLDKLNNTITTSDLNTALENFKDSLEGLGVSGLTVDADKGWLKATGETSDGDTKNFFIQMTELTKPNTPTIAETNYEVLSGGSALVEVTVKDTNGDYPEIYYRITDPDGNYGSWFNLGSGSSTTFSISSEFSDSEDCLAFSRNVELKSILNYVDSEVGTETITLTPKVSAPIVITSNSNKYGTSASITITPSVTKDSTTEYAVKDDSTGEYGDWIELELGQNETSKTFNFTGTLNQPSSVLDKKYKARATKSDYADSSENASSSINLGKKYVYYGLSTKATLENEEDVLALETSGGKLAQDSITKSTENSQTIYTVYPKKDGDGGYSFVGSNVYIWICMSDTLLPSKIYDTWNNIANMGFNSAITVKDKANVSNWNCYRLENFITVKDTTPNTTFLLKS